MTQPIDEVYVDLHARGEEQAARDIKDAIRDLQRSLDRFSDDVERSMNEMSQNVASSVADGAQQAEKSIENLADGVERDMGRIERDSKDAGDSINRNLGGGGRGFTNMLSGLAEIGGMLRNIGALVPPPIFLAIAAAIPAVLALGGALADLLPLALLLPAALGSIIGVVAAAKLAFSGFGSAVSALASGDLDKIKETMKGLSASARVVARDVASLEEPFKRLKRAVQEAFFAQLRGDMRDLGDNLFPTLQRGLSNISAALGRFGSDLLELLGAKDIVGDIGRILDGTGRIVDKIGPKVINFLGTLFGIADRGMPFMERAFDALGRGLDKVSEFLGGSMKTGEFEDFLNTAFSIMSDLGDLAGELTRLLGNLFGGFGDEGQTFIQTITKATEKLNEFLESAQGQEVLQMIIDTLPFLWSMFEVGVIILVSLLVLLERWVDFLGQVGEWVGVAAEKVGDFFGKVGEWAGKAWEHVKKFFDDVGEWFSGVGEKVDQGKNKFGEFVDKIITWFTELPGKVMNAITALPGQVLGLLTRMANLALYTIGFMIGSMIDWFLKLPGRALSALNSLYNFVVNTLTKARAKAIELVTNMVNSVVNFFTSLPGRVNNAISSLVNIVGNILSRARTTASNTASSLVNNVVSFFQSLPGRASSAMSSITSRVLGVLNGLRDRAAGVGRSIIEGVVNGIKGGISWAVDAARAAANRIIQGMKDAIGAGSPSKDSEKEVGIPLMQGVGVGVKKGASDLRSIINDAVGNSLPGIAGGTTNVANTTGGSAIEFGPGAVQVVFQGAVPTEQEAMQTGQAVGSALASVLQQRQIRAGIRVI